MATLVLDLYALDALKERRRISGLDRLDELLIVDPEKRAVDWLGLDTGEYRPIERSGLIDLGSDQLAERIDWP